MLSSATFLRGFFLESDTFPDTKLFLISWWLWAMIIFNLIMNWIALILEGVSFLVSKISAGRENIFRSLVCDTTCLAILFRTILLFCRIYGYQNWQWMMGRSQWDIRMFGWQTKFCEPSLSASSLLRQPTHERTMVFSVYLTNLSPHNPCTLGHQHPFDSSALWELVWPLLRTCTLLSYFANREKFLSFSRTHGIMRLCLNITPGFLFAFRCLAQIKICLVVLLCRKLKDAFNQVDTKNSGRLNYNDVSVAKFSTTKQMLHGSQVRTCNRSLARPSFPG